MTIIHRTVETGIHEHNYKNNAQAALNSDGCITIRDYDYSSSDDEIMLILSKHETRAVFELMSKIGKLCNVDLPF